MPHKTNAIMSHPPVLRGSAKMGASARIPNPGPRTPTRICFATGSRAEFGLMHSTLRTISAHHSLRLQLLVTGMHLDRRLGHSIDLIRTEGWKIDAAIPWPRSATPTATAASTGRAIARMAHAFDRLKTDIILIVGDRVEAFAAASAAHISGRIVAHVHGGDRALGQVDDALRHAITKLAHVHFPATRQSADRIARLGEDPWRIHLVGSPGLDDIHTLDTPCPPSLTPRRYALLILHPADPDDQLEYRRADMILQAVQSIGFRQIVIIHPNNDPGAGGILRRWRQIPPALHCLLPNAPRPLFLCLLRHAALLVGNSSSGIIEAASFQTPVLDIGPRQHGRQHGANVTHVDYNPAAITRALQSLWNNGRPRRAPGANVYGSGHTGRKIADILGRLQPNERLRHKLINY